MAQVPWDNLKVGALQVVLVSPVDGEMYAAGGALGTGGATAAKQDQIITLLTAANALLTTIAANTTPVP